MTMNPPELQRKVRQLDNDMGSVYELLFAIQNTQQRHGNRIAELTDMVVAHDARFDRHDARFDAVDARFDAVDERLDGLAGKLDTVLDLLQRRGPSGA